MPLFIIATAVHITRFRAFDTERVLFHIEYAGSPTLMPPGKRAQRFFARQIGTALVFHISRRIHVISLAWPYEAT